MICGIYRNYINNFTYLFNSFYFGRLGTILQFALDEVPILIYLWILSPATKNAMCQLMNVCLPSNTMHALCTLAFHSSPPPTVWATTSIFQRVCRLSLFASPIMHFLSFIYLFSTHFVNLILSTLP